MVICHADLHGGNLLVAPDGELFILDWEGAMIAPPEQDLFFFAGESYFWDLFWPNYSRKFEGAGLDVDALSFYYYRRGLEDLTEWLERLVHVRESEAKVRVAIHWADETLRGMSKIEQTLESQRGRVAPAES